jgi:hypothetical protein
MFVNDAFHLYVWWASALLVVEFLTDLAWLVASIRWLFSNQKDKANASLKLAAMAIIVHAIRVLVFVLGRTGPWVNFDVRAEHHADYSFEWFWVYFAGTLSALSVIALALIWYLIRKSQR